MSFALSTARTQLVPPHSWMGGYGANPTLREATGTYSPLQARCAVIWDDGRPNVLVSADVLNISPAVETAVRSALAMPAADLLLLASHTHTGPATGAPDPYIMYGITGLDESWLVDALVSVVTEALAATPEPATLDCRNTSQSWSANRAGLTYRETTVPVIVAWANGTPRAVFYSYGCHPVTMGPLSLLDGDYPAAASATIEAAIPGSIALYLPGAAGDQDPVGTRGLSLRCRLGAQLGSAVVTAAWSTGRAVTGPITTSRSVATLPLDITPTPANLAAVRDCYEVRAADPARLDWVERHAQQMIGQIDTGTYATTVPAPIQVWRFGTSLRFGFVAGELPSGYGMYFRQRYPDLVIGGYLAGTRCYPATNELLARVPSYEGGRDSDFPGIAGGSQCIYGHIGHFLAGPGGIESTLIAALTSMLD